MDINVVNNINASTMILNVIGAERGGDTLLVIGMSSEIVLFFSHRSKAFKDIKNSWHGNNGGDGQFLLVIRIEASIVTSRALVDNLM